MEFIERKQDIFRGFWPFFGSTQWSEEGTGNILRRDLVVHSPQELLEYRRFRLFQGVRPKKSLFL